MTKDNTIDEMGRINPKDPQAELRKKIDIRVFEMLGITKALKKDSWDYKTHVDTALNEILALFQAHQLELLSELLGQFPPTDYEGRDYLGGFNDARGQFAEILNRKIGELNGNL